MCKRYLLRLFVCPFMPRDGFYINLFHLQQLASTFNRYCDTIVPFQSLAIGDRAITLVAREGAGWQNNDVAFIFPVLAVFVTRPVATGVGPTRALACRPPLCWGQCLCQLPFFADKKGSGDFQLAIV